MERSSHNSLKLGPPVSQARRECPHAQLSSAAGGAARLPADHGDAPQQLSAPKHRRSANKTLALRHAAPPRGAPDSAASFAMAQWTRQHVDFLCGTTAQTAAIGATSAAAAGATAGFVANLAQAGPFGPVCAALAVVFSSLDIRNTHVNAQQAKRKHLIAHVLLAEQQRLRAAIEQRAQSGQPEPDDAALQPLVEGLIDTLQAAIAGYESAQFHDPHSPHARQARAALERQAQAIVELKAEHDRCGDQILQLQAQLYTPGFAGAQRAGIQDAIEGLEQRQLDCVDKARTLRKQMKDAHSRPHMKALVKQRLASAREELPRAQQDAWLHMLDHGPDVANRIKAGEFERRCAVLRLLNERPAEQQNPLLRTYALNMALLDQRENEQLPPDVCAAIDAMVEGLADQPALIRIDAELAQLQRKLEQEQADTLVMQQLEQEILALEQDLERLDRPLEQLMLDPFGDLGPAKLDQLRDTVLNTAKSLIDLGAAANTASVVWHLVQPVISSINIMLPAWLLNVYTGRLDIKGGKREMAGAAAAKMPVLDKATHAAQLYQSHCQDTRPAVRACQYPLQAMVHSAARELKELHRLSQWGKKRKASGLQSIASAIALLVTGLITLFTGVPVVLPFAVFAGSSGTAYAGAATQFLFHARSSKHARKQRDAVAAAFVRRYGVQAIGEFYCDMAEGHAARWTDRLNSLHQQLRRTRSGRDTAPQLLAPHTLVANEGLAIEHLSNALFVRARDQGVGVPSPEADLVAQLAQAQGKPDPSSWALSGFASPALYLQQVRQALSELYGNGDGVEEQLPLQKADALVSAAGEVNACIERHFSQRNALTEDETLSSWIRAVAEQPERFGERLAALSPAARQRLRDQLAHLGKLLREQGIGPRELFVLQTLSAARPEHGTDHPLKAFPQLMAPHSAYLLELIADPSWLDAPAAHTAHPAAPQAQARDHQVLGQLIGAIKTTGRELRDGPAVNRPRTPSEDDTAAPRPHRRWGSRLKSGMRTLKTRPHAVAKHVYQQLPNPMATPAKALDQMGKTHSDAELQLLLQKILLSFAREVGGPDHVLEKNPEVMAALPADASDTDVKRAHLRSWVQSAGKAAATTAKSIERMSEDRPKDARGLKRMAKRMNDTQSFCHTLNNALLDNKRPWEATLGPIQVA